jgi:hypothetical protein
MSILQTISKELSAAKSTPPLKSPLSFEKKDGIKENSHKILGRFLTRSNLLPSQLAPWDLEGKHAFTLFVFMFESPLLFTFPKRPVN